MVELPSRPTRNPRRESFWKSPLPAALLLLADIGGLSLAWIAAYLTRHWMGRWLGPLNEPAPYIQVFPLIVAIGLINAALFGLYVVRRRLSSINKWRALLQAGYHYLLYMMVIGYFFKELDLGRLVILFAGLYGFIYLYASRSVFRALKTVAIEQGRGLVRTIVVGTGELARDVVLSLRQHQEVGFKIVGAVSHAADPQDELTALDVRILGSADKLESLLRELHIEEVFVAIAHLGPADQLNIINLDHPPGLRIQMVSNLFGVITNRAKVDEISRFPVVTLRDGHLSAPQAFAKRFFDLIVAGVGAFVWILFFHWWIALMIRRDSRGPTLFTQERVGRDGRPFRIYKYRTMRTDAAAYAVAPTAQDDPRVTRAGKWLRKTSLDELPQLINVLRGEMAMVGPRPEMPFIVDEYDHWQRRRLDVKPGITGLWQVIGRKNLPLHLNMEYDFYYIMNQSLLLDIEILIRTVPAVLKGRGAF